MAEPAPLRVFSHVVRSNDGSPGQPATRALLAGILARY